MHVHNFADEWKLHITLSKSANPQLQFLYFVILSSAILCMVPFLECSAEGWLVRLLGSIIWGFCSHWKSTGGGRVGRFHLGKAVMQFPLFNQALLGDSYKQRNVSFCRNDAPQYCKSWSFCTMERASSIAINDALKWNYSKEQCWVQLCRWSLNMSE